MQMRIDVWLDENFIKDMLALYITSSRVKSKKRNKKDFVTYMRIQVELYGVCKESQFGQEFVRHNEELVDSLYSSWFIKKVRS